MCMSEAWQSVRLIFHVGLAKVAYQPCHQEAKALLQRGSSFELVVKKVRFI